MCLCGCEIFHVASASLVGRNPEGLRPPDN